jgi:hypothetical protein
MKTTERRIEQRHHQRFQAEDGAYTVLRYKPTEFGQIMNMSRDGLAVRYTDNGRKLADIPKLDIFIIDHHFYMKNIQVRTVSDFKLADANPLRSKKIRQRCFQFGEMKPGQLFQLDYFLENHTVSYRSDKDM